MSQDASDGNSEVDVRKWWVLFAADASSRMAFGESFGLLDAGKKNGYVRTLEMMNVVGAITAEFPALRALGPLIPGEKWRSFWYAREKNREYARQAVASTRRVGSHSNVFTLIVAEAEREGSRVSEKLLINEAAGLIVAGSDTTANSLTYLVWLILCRPDLQEALVIELKNNLPADEFSDQDLEKLPILNAAIKETMRLYGAAPAGLPRTPPRGGATLSDGRTYVPEGATASTQSWTLHRDPKIWTNPDEFDISRWMPDTILTDTQKLVYSPFGWGPRSCLGIHFAQMEMRFATAFFFRTFPTARLAPATTESTMKPREFFVISPVGSECKIILK
ncbi:Cytochrome P450 [Neofusicoccum parvum]|nr:Cytochrome P450 [Neofusicoccum parvum]